MVDGKMTINTIPAEMIQTKGQAALNVSDMDACGAALLKANSV